MFSFQGSSAFNEGLQKRLINKFYEILGQDGQKFAPSKATVTFNTDHEPYFDVLIPKIVSHTEDNLLDVFNKRLLMYNPSIFLKHIEDDGFPSTEQEKEVLISKLEYLKMLTIQNDQEKENGTTNLIIAELNRLAWQVNERFKHAGDDYRSHWVTFIGDGGGGLTQTLIRLKTILK